MSTIPITQSRKVRTWRRLSTLDVVALLIIAFPFATAAAALIHSSVNIPFEDDYQAIANFMGVYAGISGHLHRLVWVLTSQHNEYKLILLHIFVALQYELTGHTNYRVLQLLGNLSIPAILGLLWLILARQRRPFSQAIWLFILPCYLFLCLRYSETLNFAMSEFATLAVVPLAMGCILCFTSSRPRMVLWGTVLLVLGIAALGSGFFIPLALIPILLYQRRYPAVLAVVAATGAMAILYRVHYVVDRPHPPNPAPHSTLLLYPIVFLGDIFTKLSECTLLGAVLIVVFVILFLKGWPRRSPGTFTIALFCLITAAVVSAGRYNLGIVTAMSSRYSMYALLLICAEYLAILEMFAPRQFRRESTTSIALAIVTAITALWSLDTQAREYRGLHAREKFLKIHLILWERHPDHLVLTPDEPDYMYGSFWIPWRQSCQPILQREISGGRYVPPVTAGDPLPFRPHSQSTQGIEDEPAPIGSQRP